MDRIWAHSGTRLFSQNANNGSRLTNDLGELMVVFFFMVFLLLLSRHNNHLRIIVKWNPLMEKPLIVIFSGWIIFQNNEFSIYKKLSSPLE